VFTNTLANLLFIDNIEDSCMILLPIFLIQSSEGSMTGIGGKISPSSTES
jgi:hypothetical protein